MFTVLRISASTFRENFPQREQRKLSQSFYTANNFRIAVFLSISSHALPVRKRKRKTHFHVFPSAAARWGRMTITWMNSLIFDNIGGIIKADKASSQTSWTVFTKSKVAKLEQKLLSRQGKKCQKSRNSCRGWVGRKFRLSLSTWHVPLAELYFRVMSWFRKQFKSQRHRKRTWFSHCQLAFLHRNPLHQTPLRRSFSSNWFESQTWLLFRIDRRRNENLSHLSSVNNLINDSTSLPRARFNRQRN